MIREFSAGGLVVRRFRGRPFLCAVRVKQGTLLALPKGHIESGESAADAARREVREELGCELEQLAAVSTHFSGGEGKRDTIHLFRARAAGTLTASSFEVAEVGCFALDDLPPTTSPATRRRVSEHLGLRERDGRW